jgi:hypothetical protein
MDGAKAAHHGLSRQLTDPLVMAQGGWDGHWAWSRMAATASCWLSRDPAVNA